MARAELSPGIESMRGKLAGWSGMQMRFKRWKAMRMPPLLTRRTKKLVRAITSRWTRTW